MKSESSYKSIKKGFNKAWMRHEEYKIIGNFLIPSGGHDYYFPGASLNILNDFSKIKTERDILNFTKKYGRLGYAEICPGSGIKEPTYWIMKHAEIIKFCLEISKLYKENCPKCKERNCPDYCGELNNFKKYVKTDHISYYNLSEYAELYFRDYKNLKVLALRIFKSIVNVNTKRVSQELDFNEEGVLSTFYNYPSLIELIYWFLSKAIQNKKINHCKKCNNITTRRKYCSDACGNAERQATFRGKPI